MSNLDVPLWIIECASLDHFLVRFVVCEGGTHMNIKDSQDIPFQIVIFYEDNDSSCLFLGLDNQSNFCASCLPQMKTEEA